MKKTYRQIIDTHILNGNTKAVIVKIRQSNKLTHLVSKIGWFAVLHQKNNQKVCEETKTIVVWYTMSCL